MMNICINANNYAAEREIISDLKYCNNQSSNRACVLHIFQPSQDLLILCYYAKGQAQSNRNDFTLLCMDQPEFVLDDSLLIV